MGYIRVDDAMDHQEENNKKQIKLCSVTRYYGSDRTTITFTHKQSPYTIYVAPHYGEPKHNFLLAHCNAYQYKDRPVQISGRVKLTGTKNKDQRQLFMLVLN